MPRIYKQHLANKAARKDLAQYTQGGGSSATKEYFEQFGGEGIQGHLKGRRFLDAEAAAAEGFENILDPLIKTERLGQIAMDVARQEGAVKLASSPFVRSTGEVWVAAAEVLSDPMAAAAFGIVGKHADAVRAAIKTAKATGHPKGMAVVAEELGWKKITDVYPPGVTKYFDKETAARWVDPMAVKELQHADHAIQNLTNDLVRGLGEKYLLANTVFKAAKTIMNPATHVRNMMGAKFAYYSATGDAKGTFSGFFKTYNKHYADDTLEWQQATERQLLGSSLDAELARDINKAGERMGLGVPIRPDKTVLDPWLDVANIPHDGKLVGTVRKGMGAAERFYRTTDEAAKFAAFVHLKKKGLAKGLTDSEAADMAASEVWMYMPTYATTSEFGELARQAVPFASFTTEALRNYKNLAIHHPARAYALNHVTETAATTLGLMVGADGEEIEQAKENLPGYLKNHKMLLLPYRDEGKLNFMDFSYVMPLANISEGAKAGSLFFDELYPVGSNPITSITIALAAGKDAFTGRDIKPDFTERQLGVAVESKTGRKVVGMMEHVARTFLPPWVPPGSGGVNMLEALRGTKHPKTGQPLEKSMKQTLAANLMAYRTYSPSVESNVLNIKHIARERGKKITQSWNRWETARMDGNIMIMEEEKAAILVRRAAGGDPDPEAYFAKSVKRRKPFNNMSTKQLKNALDKAAAMGALGERDKRVRAELLSRYQTRGNK